MLTNILHYSKIVFLTGAGISVASGLKTYRGEGGVWEKFNVDKYGHIDQLQKEPLKVWQLFGALRNEVNTAEPNACHQTLAKLERKLLAGQELIVYPKR